MNELPKKTLPISTSGLPTIRLLVVLKNKTKFDSFQKTLKQINPFLTSVSLLYTLKTSENFWFSEVFRQYRSGTLVENGLM